MTSYASVFYNKTKQMAHKSSLIKLAFDLHFLLIKCKSAPLPHVFLFNTKATLTTVVKNNILCICNKVCGWSLWVFYMSSALRANFIEMTSAQLYSTCEAHLMIDKWLFLQITQPCSTKQMTPQSSNYRFLNILQHLIQTNYYLCCTSRCCVELNGWSNITPCI